MQQGVFLFHLPGSAFFSQNSMVNMETNSTGGQDLLESHEGFTYKSASNGDFSGTLLRCVLGHGCLH
jgi:hypothetical protein